MKASLKKKAEKKPVYKIQHGRVHYRYVIGISWIQIETDPETDWPEMPEYMAVCFTVDNPNPEWAELFIQIHSRHEIEKFITKAIKQKTNEQRRAHGATVGGNQPLGKHPDQQEPKAALLNHKGKRRKPDLPMLPFEGDIDTAK